MFSWSRPSPTPASTPAPHNASGSRTRPLPTISRDVHLSSYLGHQVLKASTRKVSNDDTIYDTVFQTTNGFALIIRVYIPVDVGRAPSMTLHGVRASHDWLDIRMKVIGYDPISSDQAWKQANIKLGDAVYSVIHHLQINPPTILEIIDANLRRFQESVSGQQKKMGGSAKAPGHETSYRQSQKPKDPVQHQDEDQTIDMKDDEVNALIPQIPTSFPEIDVMPLSELESVVADESALERIIERTSEVVTLKEIKQSIEAANVEAAQTNLNHEEELKELQTELEVLKQDLQIKVKKYRELDENRLAMTRPPDVQEAIRELNKAKKEAYRESENMAEDWTESGGDVTDFVKKFMEFRLLYHTRAAKAERLSIVM